MNPQAPFQPQDLDDLDLHLLDQAIAVVSMSQVYDGQTWKRVIGLRHDVDNVIEPAVQMAQWEHDRGYRSTYYILHGTGYWADKTLLRTSLEAIADLGHEIGIHNNAIAEAVRTGVDPRQILSEAVLELRGYGFEVRGTVAHGDNLCYQDGQVRFVNDELFEECPRPQLGAPDRTVAGMPLRPVPLSSLGLEYDANWLRRGAYLSDSGGRWSGQGFQATADLFPFDGQLHVLTHPCWWGEAFVAQEIAA